MNPMTKKIVTIMTVAAFALAIGTAQAYEPTPGSLERDAICNSVRLALAENEHGSLQRDALHGARFIIEGLDVENMDAVFVAHGENGAYLGRQIWAHLRCVPGGWVVLAMNFN
jgi:hypothetical protein